MSLFPLSMSIRQYCQHINKYTSISFFNTPHNNKQKLITNLPEEIIILIAENLLPADSKDNNWIENIKNFQYACKIFFRVGFIVRDAFFLPFFNFENNFPETPDSKVNAWFSMPKKVHRANLWMQIDNLIMSTAVKPFDVFQILEFLRYGHEEAKSLPKLIELGVLKEEDLQDLTVVQRKYISSASALLAILKEKPDWSSFKEIPDNFLRGNNYEMIYMAYKENKQVFDNMAKSRICFNYQDPCSDNTPFIQTLSFSTIKNHALMCALYPHIDAHACNLRGENAVHAAAKNGNIDALIFLHAHGVDFQKKNYDGQSPIFLSVLNQHYYFTLKLLEYGQPATVRDKNGNTILMAAAQKLDIISLNIFATYLIASGMPIRAANNEGKNILHILFETESFKEFSSFISEWYSGYIKDIKLGLQIKGYYKKNPIFSEITNFIDNLRPQIGILAYVKNKYHVSPLEFLERNFNEKVVRFFKKYAKVA